MRSIRGRLRVVREAGRSTAERLPSFSLMLLRDAAEQGIPARARCGFGAYFEPGKFIDHWVREYWNAGRSRWMMVDAQNRTQLHQKKLFRLDFDPLDVPRDRFHHRRRDAWVQKCREGKADPAAFGILDMYGLWISLSQGNVAA